MHEQEQHVNNQPAEQEPAPRPWVTPTFERVELQKALSGYTTSSTDSVTYNS